MAFVKSSLYSQFCYLRTKWDINILLVWPRQLCILLFCFLLLFFLDIFVLLSFNSGFCTLSVAEFMNYRVCYAHNLIYIKTQHNDWFLRNYLGGIPSSSIYFLLYHTCLPSPLQLRNPCDREVKPLPVRWTNVRQIIFWSCLNFAKITHMMFFN